MKIRKFGLKKTFGILTTTSVLLIITFFAVQRRPREFDPTRVALIDQVGSNLVFRGNNPLKIKDGVTYFAKEELTARFNEVLSEKGLPLLSEYYLIDFNLLDINEYYIAQFEKKYFLDNPSLGEFTNVSLIRPNLIVEKIPEIPFFSNLIINDYNVWATKVVEEIRNFASIKKDLPVVVFVHCNAGRDRTGMLVAYYKLRFDKSNAVSEVRADNILEAGRHTYEVYDRAIGTYCHFLNDRYGKSIRCD